MDARAQHSGVHAAQSPRVRGAVRALGQRARHRRPHGGDAPGAGELSALLVLLPAEKRQAANLPHAIRATHAGADVVPLAGAQQSHPAQSGVRSGHAEAREAVATRGAERGRSRALDDPAGRSRSAGSARPRHPRNFLLDRNPSYGAGESETLQRGPSARDAFDLARQGKEGPRRAHRRPGARVGGQISARSEAAVRDGAGRRNASS